MRSGITRKIAVATLAAALAVIGLSTPAHADDTTGTISGQFTDSQGQPIADAQVVVETPNGSWITYAYTDEQGNYTETQVVPGTYIILFSWGALSQFGHGTPNYYVDICAKRGYSPPTPVAACTPTDPNVPPYIVTTCGTR